MICWNSMRATSSNEHSSIKQLTKRGRRQKQRCGRMLEDLRQRGCRFERLPDIRDLAVADIALGRSMNTDDVHHQSALVAANDLLK